MYSSCRLSTSFLTFTRHRTVCVRESIGTLTRQFAACNRGVSEQQTSSRSFTTCARAYVKSVQKFGRKIRHTLLSKEKSKMSGDSSEVLAPLQAAVKEKVRLNSAKITTHTVLSRLTLDYGCPVPTACWPSRPFCFRADVSFFFFRHLILEVTWPIVTKLCHVWWWPRFTNRSEILGLFLPKNLAAQKRKISTWFQTSLWPSQLSPEHKKIYSIRMQHYNL